MADVGRVGGNLTVVVQTTPGPVVEGASMFGDGNIIDANSAQAGNFTAQRTTPDGTSKFFLTEDGARVYDRLARVRGPFAPQVFKDGEPGINAAVERYVTSDRQDVIGVGNPGGS